MVFAIAIGSILVLAAIGGFVTRRRGRGFYSKTLVSDPDSVDGGLSRAGSRGGWTGGGIQDDTFTRKYL